MKKKKKKEKKAIKIIIIYNNTISSSVSEVSCSGSYPAVLTFFNKCDGSFICREWPGVVGGVVGCPKWREGVPQISKNEKKRLKYKVLIDMCHSSLRQHTTHCTRPCCREAEMKMVSMYMRL